MKPRAPGPSGPGAPGSTVSSAGVAYCQGFRELDPPSARYIESGLILSGLAGAVDSVTGVGGGGPSSGTAAGAAVPGSGGGATTGSGSLASAGIEPADGTDGSAGGGFPPMAGVDGEGGSTGLAGGVFVGSSNGVVGIEPTMLVNGGRGLSPELVLPSRRFEVSQSPLKVGEPLLEHVDASG